MPRIPALPPVIEPIVEADLVPIENISTGQTEKATFTQIKEFFQSLIGWITSAMIGTDQVTATKIDWASTGADGGIWWEELGRTTLSGAGDTITVSSLPARRYLQIRTICIATGGTINANLTFNGDTGANYTVSRISVDNTGVVSSAAASAQTSVPLAGTATAANRVHTVDIVNISSIEKAVTFIENLLNTAGPANVNSMRSGVAKWTNTTNAITSVTLNNGAGTGDFAIGSELVVLGHN